MKSAFSTIITLGACASLASATCWSEGEQLISFDNVEASAGTSILNKVPMPLHGLDFTAFRIENDGAELTGLQPISKPNDGFYSAITQTEDQANPSFEVATPYSYIDLKSMYFGCAIDAGVARVANACTVIASGITYAGEAVSTSFEIVNPSDTMTFVEYPSTFSMVKQVSFATLAGNRATTIATSFDNIIFDLYTNCDK